MATLALSVAGQFVGGALAGPVGATIGRALGALAGSAIDGALFGERPEITPGRDIRLTGSSEGAAIPRLYGWGRVAGNIIWATELEEVEAESAGAKGGGLGGGAGAAPREVLASFALGLCAGEVQRLGRIWADGQLLETESLLVRFYSGSETQAVDPLIEARQGAGAAPAYRGLSYLVFERLPLSPFGNRIPNITVELCRVVGELEPLIRSVAIIPGATEFGYDPVPRVRLLGPGATAGENLHQSAELSDWTLSLDELQALCPNLEHVSLVVAWFGDDLRCGACQLRPKVEAASRSVRGTSWSVAGLTRATAGVVTTHAGGPAYGGTPSDAAVRAAIADLTARGLAVTLYPMILMDIPAENVLGQPAYPWRGRIGCDPPAGAPGSPEGTAALDAQIAAFIGSAAGWGLRRMVRHYAALAAEAGAESLVIASELVGLTPLRGASGFPMVEALVALAAEAKALAPDVALTYAADWSEYHGHQPAEAPGDKYFHLDPLWASPDIAAVGVDAYFPGSDWREGEDHPDFAAWDGPHALDYLTANVAGGEGYDWYYQSAADRLAGLRTPIPDLAHGEPWVWRIKDVAGWWNHAHHERIGGVRQASPTAWVPGMKPVWFTELGCAAVDKGANQPNLFPDPKSAESGRPYFSSGAPDGLMQRQFLRAQLRHWAADPMVERVSLWAWDARPWPAFPADRASWADAPNHGAGHWLTGRLGALAADELVSAVAADHGVSIMSEIVAPPLLHGLLLEGVGSARAALEGVLEGTGLTLRASADGLELVAAQRRTVTPVADPVAADGAIVTRRRPDPGELPARLALGYLDRDRDYLAASALAVRPEGAALAGRDSGLVLDAAAARQMAEGALLREAARRDTLELVLPPALARLEPGDCIELEGEPDGPFEIVEIRDGLARRVTARALPPKVTQQLQPHAEGTGRRHATPIAPALPLLFSAHLPGTVAEPMRSRLLLGAFARPWPGTVDIRHAATGSRLARLESPAAIGTLLTPLAPGPVGRWDRQQLEVELHGGHLAGLPEQAVLAGGNRLAVTTDAGGCEVLGFLDAQLISPRRYRLGPLLRGLEGTDPAMGPTTAGQNVMLIDDAAVLLSVDPGWVGATQGLIAYAGRTDATGTALEVPLDLAPLQPLRPVHLSARRLADGDIAFAFIRRSRADAGNWAEYEVPEDVSPPLHRIAIVVGGATIRTIESVTGTALYPLSAQLADFGGPAPAFAFTVAAFGPRYGAGVGAGGSFDA